MNVQGVLQTWLRVLTQPGVEVMAEERERPDATLSTALIWIVIAAVISAILGYLQVTLALGGGTGLEAMFDQMDLPPESRAVFDNYIESGLFTALAGGASLGTIFIAPIMFFLGVVIYHFVASLLGGSGDLGRFAFLNATFQAPITIVSAILGFVPLLGGCVGLLLSIYSFVLTYFAVGAEYNLSPGRAIAVVLLPILVLFLIAICGIVALAGSLAALR